MRLPYPRRLAPCACALGACDRGSCAAAALVAPEASVFRADREGTTLALKVVMNSRHTVAWLDHQEAHVFYIGSESFTEAAVLSAHPHRRLHRKSGPGADSGQRAKEDHAYYEDVTAALAGSEEILIVGPAAAKLELVKHIHERRHDLEQRIIGVETVDHPTDRQIVAYARRYFEAADAGR